MTKKSYRSAKQPTLTVSTSRIFHQCITDIGFTLISFTENDAPLLIIKPFPPPLPPSADMVSAFRLPSTIHALRHTLSNHPAVVSFRWSPTHSYLATWTFLFAAVAIYLLSGVILHTISRLVRRFNHGGRLPLRPLHVTHDLLIAVVSAVIFLGMLLSAVEEINETRWLWRRTRTSNSVHWLLCFPLGTRPSGRVFFWSYAYYLSRFLHLLRTYFDIASHSSLTFFALANQSIPLVSSFLWLEFSQSFQVVGVLLTTSLHAVVYGYQFWTAVGLPRAGFPFVVNCQVVVAVCNLLCHLGVLVFHFSKGGCNGIVAWSINSFLNGVVLICTLKFYVGKMHRTDDGRKED